MVGGGPDAFIGEVHRMAARLDGKIELVCGCFSTDPVKTRKLGQELFLSADRLYNSYQQMFMAEAALPPELRMDFVSVVTPNHLHVPVVAAALEYGFHVVCDKPLAMSFNEAKEVRDRIKASGKLFCLTHNYTGYPMVKQARAMVNNGQLGEIRKVIVEYPQGWLATSIEAAGQKQASWRTDPNRSGISGAMGDIGSHAENLTEYITGLKITSVCADLTAFVPGRQLDDDGSVLLRFDNGAKGVLTASQIAVGEENPFCIRVYGEKAGLYWHQMRPDSLEFSSNDAPAVTYRAGWSGTLPEAAVNIRLPAGHPEGFIEAFANLYRNFAVALTKVLSGQDPGLADFPTIEDGVRSMAFIEAVTKSSRSEQKWISLPN